MFIDGVAVRFGKRADYRAMEADFVHHDAWDAGIRARRGILDDEFSNDVHRRCRGTTWLGFAFRTFGAFRLRDSGRYPGAIRAYANGLGSLRPGCRRERGGRTLYRR